MKISRYLIIACVISLSGVSVLGQSTTKPTTVPVGEMIMPEERFKNATLDQVLRSIRDKSPDFNYTIIREPGLPENYPLIEDLITRNISVDQFFSLIKQIYGIEREPLEGPSGVLWVFRVQQLGGDAGGDLVEQAREATRRVQVYRLTEIISGLATSSTEKPDQKKIINDVLSLVQAAIKESGNGKDISLQVHEPTQVLMVNGTQGQLSLISRVLDELRPSKEEVSARNAGLGLQLSQAQKILADSQNMQRQLQMENDGLRRQLDAMQSSTTRPKE